MDNIPDVTITGEAAGDYFGNSVSGAGDVNGDGYDDVIVGAYFSWFATGRSKGINFAHSFLNLFLIKEKIMVIKILCWLFVVIASIPFVMICIFWVILMAILEFIYSFFTHIIKGIENGRKFGYKEGIQYIIYGSWYNNWW